MQMHLVVFTECLTKCAAALVIVCVHVRIQKNTDSSVLMYSLNT